jgi:putative ABC transport system ATP-binding protein
VVRIHVRPLSAGGGVIAVHSLEKVYGTGDQAVAALAGVDLTIGDGEFVAIVGQSGSGKSTLLHLLGGLDTATRGDVTIDGTALARMSDDELTIFRRRRIGFVFQFFNLLPTLSAEENVALPLALDGQRGAAVAARVDAALAQVGLAHRKHHRPDELSGGEMQRVAIARALVVGPALILADEPTGNLDSTTGDHILDLLRDANERHHTTVVLVTHDHHAADYAHRRITMRDGRVVEDTPTDGGHHRA